MGSLVHSAAHRLMRRGLRRGLVEGSVAWIVIGAAAGVVRYVTRPEPPLVARENLRLGESVLVTHVPAYRDPARSAAPPRSGAGDPRAFRDRRRGRPTAAPRTARRGRAGSARRPPRPALPDPPRQGASFQSHAGVVEHDALIGQPEGSEVVAWRRDGQSGPARRFLAVRPTLADVIVKMPRARR